MSKTLLSSRSSYAIVLGLLATLGPLCTDLYLPALPKLALELSTTDAAAQLSLTAGLLGLGIGQLIFGPLSDKLGRRTPLLVSLFILLLASIWCAMAQDIHHLIAARVIQGLAGAGGAVLSRAVARDLYHGHELTRFFALLMLINGLAPIVAPVMGGELLRVVDWRGIFIVLAVIAVLLLLLAALRLPETLPPQRRVAGGVRTLIRSVVSLLAQRQFMGLCLAQGFAGAGMFAYIGASPFVLQDIYRLSPQMFSLCFAVNGVGLILSAQISSRLSRLFGEMQILKAGLAIAGVSSLLLLLASGLQAPLIWLLIPLFFTVFIIGIVGPSASALAMQSQGNNAGSASALLGVSMFTLGAASVPLTGLFGTSALSMALIIAICYALAIGSFVLLTRRAV